MEFEDLSQQRIDFSEGPEGETIATLTVTLQDGSVHRYTESVTPDEIDNLANVIAHHEVAQRKIEGYDDDPEAIEGIFDFVGKAVKAVGNVAKKVVTSKVFKTAAKGLAVVAPALGPFAPAAMGVSGAMGAASAIGTAAVAAEAGAKKAAKSMTRAAGNKVKQTVRSPKARVAMLRVATRKAKTAQALASRKPSKRRRRKAKKPRVPSVFKAAKEGRLRSLQAGNVTGKKLRKAMKSGRVFWIARSA